MLMDIRDILALPLPRGMRGRSIRRGPTPAEARRAWWQWHASLHFDMEEIYYLRHMISSLHSLDGLRHSRQRVFDEAEVVDVEYEQALTRAHQALQEVLDIAESLHLADPGPPYG